MKSIYYIRLIIGVTILTGLAACQPASLRTNCWSKAQEVSRGYSGGTC